MKKVLSRVNVVLYGIMYSFTLILLGYLFTMNGFFYIGFDKYAFAHMEFPIGFMFACLALMFIGKFLWDDNTTPKAYWITAAVTLTLLSFPILALAEMVRGHGYPLIFPIVNIACITIIVINYVICAIKTWKENKELGI